MDFRSQLAGEIPHLRRFARALSGDASLADDLVQDCIERALRKSHLYDPARPLRAWLYAVLRNLFISGLRRGRPSEREEGERRGEEELRFHTPTG